MTQNIKYFSKNSSIVHAAAQEQLQAIQTITQMAVHLADNAESLLDWARINQQKD